MKLSELRGKLTKKETAKLLGIEEKTYANYENEITEPKIKTLIAIADYYNVSLDYLCNRPFNNNIGYIPEEKKEVVKMILQLNQENTLKLFGYVSGLLAMQE